MKPLVAVIVPAAVRLLNPLISLLESTTTALLATTVPAVAPSNVFNSLADDVTNVPANLRPPSAKSWDAISNTWFPSVAPIVTTPLPFCVTALLFSEVPNVVISK